MEVGIALPVGVENGPRLVAFGRVVRLQTEVEAQQEVCEVHTQTDAVGRGDFLVKILEAELAVGLVGVVLDGPHVAGIDEQSAFEHPEQLGAVHHRSDEGDGRPGRTLCLLLGTGGDICDPSGSLSAGRSKACRR